MADCYPGDDRSKWSLDDWAARVDELEAQLPEAKVERVLGVLEGTILLTGHGVTHRFAPDYSRMVREPRAHFYERTTYKSTPWVLAEDQG